jgi:hypothetical protein
LRLYNSLGQLIQERYLGTDEHKWLVGLDGYPAGNYSIVLLGDGKQLTNEKFTIVR